jgi:hypothetical protein
MGETRVTFEGSVKDLANFVKDFFEIYSWPGTLSYEHEMFDLRDIRPRREGQYTVIGGGQPITGYVEYEDGGETWGQPAEYGHAWLATVQMIRITDKRSELRIKTSDWLDEIDAQTRAKDEAYGWNRWPSSAADRQAVINDCHELMQALIEDMIDKKLNVGNPTWIGMEVQESDSPQPHKLLPKTGAARERYRKAWPAILEMYAEYRDEYEDTNDFPWPKKEDIAERLFHLGIYRQRPSVKTIERIIKAGEEGLLDDT